MISNGNNLKANLTKAQCNKCGTSLDSAKVVPVSQMPLGVVSHAVCSVCKAQNMITVTSIGTGVMPLESDLTSDEIKKFVSKPSITLEDVITVHELLEKEDLCNLLHKKEQNLEKRTKS